VAVHCTAVTIELTLADISTITMAAVVVDVRLATERERVRLYSRCRRRREGYPVPPESPGLWSRVIDVDGDVLPPRSTPSP